VPQERSRRDGTGETRRTLSWIWRDNTVPLDGDDSGREDDILRVEWAKSRSRSKRATEEVLLLREEMRRTLLSLGSTAKSWRDRAGERVNVEESLKEGLRAYALEQASLQDSLALSFRAEWKAPLDTVADENDANDSNDDDEGGNEGESGNDSDGMEDEEDDDDEAEDTNARRQQRQDRDGVAAFGGDFRCSSRLQSHSVPAEMAIDE